MKNFKKMLTLLLCFALLLQIFPLSAYADYFTDVDDTVPSYYRDAINYITDNNIMIGIGDGTFAPDLISIRAMAVEVLFRMSGDTGTYTSNFTDVPSNSYYYNAISWANQNAIATGYSQTKFAPNDILTKEQLLTMMYRFASYMGESTLIDEDITQASDYLSISFYSADAIKWAYSFGLIERSSPTDAINPADPITRKDLALLAHRYLMNVEGIKTDRDRFSFANSSSAFMSGGTTYLMTEDDWDIFCGLAASAGLYSANTTQLISRKSWGGSCYGMSVAAALDYCGKIDLNGNYCNNTNTIRDIPNLRNITDPQHQTASAFSNNSIIISKAESKINLFQQSWFIEPINEWAMYIGVSNGLHELVAGQQHSGIGVFCYTTSSFGHAINVYGKPVATETGYRISAYDNRYPNLDMYIEINTTVNNSWTGGLYSPYGRIDTFKMCKYNNDFDEYNILDIDGDSNTEPQAATSTNDTVLEDYTLLRVCVDGDFVIENEEGEELICDVNGISGDMETYRQNFIPYSEDEPCEYLLVVPNSESFTCSLDSNGTIEYFYVITEDNNCGFEIYSSNLTAIHNVYVTDLFDDPEVSVD